MPRGGLFLNPKKQNFLDYLRLPVRIGWRGMLFFAPAKKKLKKHVVFEITRYLLNERPQRGIY